MAKNQAYKAFAVRPSRVLDLNGEVLDAAPVMAELTSEVRGISGYATYVVRNDMKLGSELANVNVVQPAVAGRRAGVTMPDFLATGKSGRSRKEFLVQHNVVTAFRSWQERIDAVNGTSSKYVSQGWKRTMNAAANIAARAVPKVEKARKTRAKSRKLQPQVALKTPVARDSLRYPGRDRTKHVPTPKRKNRPRNVREVILPSSPARVNMTTVIADCGAYGTTETSQAAINLGNMAYECRLCTLN